MLLIELVVFSCGKGSPFAGDRTVQLLILHCILPSLEVGPICKFPLLTHSLCIICSTVRNYVLLLLLSYGVHNMVFPQMR